MPSFSRALKKINGKIGLLGYYHLFKAQYFNDRVSLYLIGVDPKYQNKGATAVIFNELQQTFNNRIKQYRLFGRIMKVLCIKEELHLQKRLNRINGL